MVGRIYLSEELISCDREGEGAQILIYMRWLVLLQPDSTSAAQHHRMRFVQTVIVQTRHVSDEEVTRRAAYGFWRVRARNDQNYTHDCMRLAVIFSNTPRATSIIIIIIKKKHAQHCRFAVPIHVRGKVQPFSFPAFGTRVRPCRSHCGRTVCLA